MNGYVTRSQISRGSHRFVHFVKKLFLNFLWQRSHSFVVCPYHQGRSLIVIGGVNHVIHYAITSFFIEYWICVSIWYPNSLAKRFLTSSAMSHSVMLLAHAISIVSPLTIPSPHSFLPLRKRDGAIRLPKNTAVRLYDVVLFCRRPISVP